MKDRLNSVNWKVRGSPFISEESHGDSWSYIYTHYSVIGTYGISNAPSEYSVKELNFFKYFK